MYLLWSIERFLRKTGTPPTRFGRAAMGDPRFVWDLRRGRKPGDRTVRRVAAFIEANEQGGRR